ncbi:hypothetical protein JTI58_12065 [Lysinibacillus fusiformis]|uniref:hypothetical protein n=1 Tax=Lysinibacillus fusiformis TaxID=28031 RepID=UPI001967DBE6|nr:hypothetical protein [Lysinibacillus fusiformis]QSB12293.1 hypothetical protein JTI58_12065 [Lysinibacillus fusiformis]
MIGALVNTYRGFKDNHDLKNRRYILERELSTNDSIDKILDQMEDPFERILAKNQLTLAEFMNERQNDQSMKQMKKMWEMVKKQMTANIQATEEQLNNVNATKLDIARIVTTLTQLSNELDLELEDVRQRIPLNRNLQIKLEDLQNHPLIISLKKQSGKQQIDLLKFKQDITQFTQEYHQFKTQYNKDFGENRNSVLLLKFQLKNSTERIADLEEKLLEHTVATDQLEKVMNNRMTQLKKQDEGILSKVDSVIKELYTTMDELNELKKVVDIRTSKIESLLQDQYQQWTTRAHKLDQSIQEHSRHTKMTLLKLTVPLYVIVLGIIIFLFQ